jgi:hypothetical protein
VRFASPIIAPHCHDVPMKTRQGRFDLPRGV